MRLQNYSYFLVVTILLCGFTQVSVADEYGERFNNYAPAGMAEQNLSSQDMWAITADDIAAGLQNIEPVAGDESEEFSETPDTFPQDTSEEQPVLQQ